MPRAFLVKRRLQDGAVLPEKLLKVHIESSVLKTGVITTPFDISYPGSRLRVSDLPEVEVFNKCHSQFHQCHLSFDNLPGIRHLEFSHSICEQVRRAEFMDDNYVNSNNTKTFGNAAKPNENESRIRSKQISMDIPEVRRSSQEMEEVEEEISSIRITPKLTIPPAYVSEILAKQRQKILEKHVVNVQSGFFGLNKVSRKGRINARQPIAGLEYIQNGTDTHYKNIESDQTFPAKGDDCEENLTTTDEQNMLDEKQAQRKYVCEICNKGFSRSNTLVTHRRIHTGDKPFECETCGRAFRQPGNLTRHRLIHTTAKPYKCTQCGKAFNRASNLHTHMRTHTNYKPFVCQYCGKGFHQKIDMKIHSYTHTGEKPHKCKICGRGFKQLTHLTYHMRTHSDVKMYTCAYCGKGFNQKGNLQAHIYGHTGERPYKCELCGKGFTLASTLNTHRRTHANRLTIPNFSTKPRPPCNSNARLLLRRSPYKTPNTTCVEESNVLK